MPLQTSKIYKYNIFLRLKCTAVIFSSSGDMCTLSPFFAFVEPSIAIFSRGLQLYRVPVPALAICAGVVDLNKV